RRGWGGADRRRSPVGSGGIRPRGRLRSGGAGSSGARARRHDGSGARGGPWARRPLHCPEPRLRHGGLRAAFRHHRWSKPRSGVADRPAGTELRGRFGGPLPSSSPGNRQRGDGGGPWGTGASGGHPVSGGGWGSGGGHDPHGGYPADLQPDGGAGGSRVLPDQPAGGGDGAGGGIVVARHLGGPDRGLRYWVANRLHYLRRRRRALSRGSSGWAAPSSATIGPGME